MDTESADEEKKVAICHREGTGDYHLNTVSENAVAAHIAHGDTFANGGACPSGRGGEDDGQPGGTPEPVTMLLFGAGLAGIGYATRRKLGRKAE